MGLSLKAGRLETMTALLINGHREDGTQKGKHFADFIALWALKIGCEELRQLAGFCIGYLCIRRCDIPIKMWFSSEKGAFRYGCCYGCVTNLLLERRPRSDYTTGYKPPVLASQILGISAMFYDPVISPATKGEEQSLKKGV